MCYITTQELKIRQKATSMDKISLPSDHNIISGTYRKVHTEVHMDNVSDPVAALKNIRRGSRTNWARLWTVLPDAPAERHQVYSAVGPWRSSKALI